MKFVLDAPFLVEKPYLTGWCSIQRSILFVLVGALERSIPIECVYSYKDDLLEWLTTNRSWRVQQQLSAGWRNQEPEALVMKENRCLNRANLILKAM